MKEITFEYVDTKKLIPCSRKAKTYSETQIENIMYSISEFGFIVPIVIDKDNNVLAGDDRLLAAERLGLERALCVRKEHLDDIQSKADIPADNGIVELASLDDQLLKIDIQGCITNSSKITCE